MTQKIMFLVNDLSIGGMQKVNLKVVEQLKKYTDKIELGLLTTTKKDLNIPASLKITDFANWFYSNDLMRKAIKSTRVFQQFVNKGEYDPYKYVYPILKKLVHYIRDNRITTIVMSGPDLISYIPFLKDEFPNIKYISWIHSSYEKYTGDYTKGYLTSFINGVKKSNIVVCLTKKDEVLFKEMNENTIIINNPLSEPNKENLLSTLENKTICFVGRIDYVVKGLDYLVDIAKNLPDDWKIEIAGKGSSSSEKRLKADIENNNLTDKLIFKGPLYGNQLKNHYQQSSIYLMTSRWEGMPLVLAEAMSFGLPIIAFEQNGSSEVLSDGKYGVLVEQGNIVAMNKELSKLMASKKLREKFQELSLKRVKDFDIDLISKKWLEILDI